MSKKDRIDLGAGNSQLHQPLAARFAGIHQHRRIGGAEEAGGEEFSAHRGTRAGAEEEK